MMIKDRGMGGHIIMIKGMGGHKGYGWTYDDKG